MMRTQFQDDANIDRLDRGDWLYRLLTDMREELAEQPSSEAIRRIRARLLADMEPAVRAAA